MSHVRWKIIHRFVVKPTVTVTVAEVIGVCTIGYFSGKGGGNFGLIDTFLFDRLLF